MLLPRPKVSEAKMLDVILYSREQLVQESRSRQVTHSSLARTHGF